MTHSVWVAYETYRVELKAKMISDMNVDILWAKPSKCKTNSVQKFVLIALK